MWLRVLCMLPLLQEQVSLPSLWGGETAATGAAQRGARGGAAQQTDKRGQGLLQILVCLTCRTRSRYFGQLRLGAVVRARLLVLPACAAQLQLLLQPILPSSLSSQQRRCSIWLQLKPIAAATTTCQRWEVQRTP